MWIKWHTTTITAIPQAVNHIQTYNNISEQCFLKFWYLIWWILLILIATAGVWKMANFWQWKGIAKNWEIFWKTLISAIFAKFGNIWQLFPHAGQLRPITRNERFLPVQKQQHVDGGLVTACGAMLVSSVP